MVIWWENLSASEMQIFTSHFLFRRQPAEFFFSKKYCQMKANKIIFWIYNLDKKCMERKYMLREKCR